MKNELNRAENFIQNQLSLVNTTYKPILHFSASTGWINDPNGFSFDGNTFHLFYQYHPYSSKWGPMHWGHATSKNLIDWTHLPIALAPSEPYDQSGIFSGTAMFETKTMRLYYTGHVDLDGNVSQTQCIAESSDGVHFNKRPENPILDAQSMPKDSVCADFRDPKVLKREDQYLLLAGSRTQDYRGQILLYSSKDGLRFDYKNRILFPRSYGDVIECPDLFTMDGQDILVFSTQKAEFSTTVQNSFSVFAWIGLFDVDTYSFKVHSEQILDYGFDFYAPQTTQTTNESYMIAWMNSWERDQITDLLHHQWAGSMTLPRRLYLEKGMLKQAFPDSLEHSLKQSFHKDLLVLEPSHTLVIDTNDTYLFKFEIQLDKGDLQLRFLNDDEHYLQLTLSAELSKAILDRSHAQHSIHSKVGENEAIRSMDISADVTCSIVVDKSSIEILINGISMTSLFYGGEDRKNIKLNVSEVMTLRNVYVYEL